MTGLAPLLPGPAEATVFALAVAVLNATPGVDFLLTVSRTLQGGARAGALAALGIVAGCAVHALAAAFGVAALLALHPGALRLIQWLGAAYLLWLGLGLLRAAVRGAAAAPATPPAATQHGWRHFRDGVLTNLLNPKVALFFLAFLPPFVPAGSPSPTVSLLLLGAWFMLQGLAFLLLLVGLTVGLRRAAGGRAGSGLRRALQALGGGLFIALAARILTSRTA
jgi:threonine/homoserine/homoserine lactone efflux protein